MSRIVPWALMAGLAILAANNNQSTAVAQKSDKAAVPLPPRSNLILPPVEYDKPYEGNLVVQEVKTIAELIETCKVTGKKWLLGCTIRTSWGCHIYLVPESVMKEFGWWREPMMRHEIGH